MYRVHLTEGQRAELQCRTRAVGIRPRTRDRLEMIRLLAAGWRVPRTAHHLHMSARRVRFWSKQFLASGFDALVDHAPPGQTSRLTPELLECVRQELDKAERTWTTGELAGWLEANHGVRLSRDHFGRLLRRAGLSCRRTERDLGHKQDPEKVAVCQADLQTLEKGGTPGAWISVT